MSADAITNINEISLITDNLCFLIGCFETLAKGFKCCIEYENIKKLVNDIYEPIDIIKKKNNVQVMKWITEIADFENRQFFIFLGVIILLASARIFSADIKNREFPVRIFVPFDASEPPYYHLMYVAISYGVLIVDYSLFGVDIMVIVIIRYLTVQLEILKANCRHCRSDSIKRAINLSSNKDSKIFRRSAMTNALIDGDNNEDIEIKEFVMFEVQEKNVYDEDTFDWRFKHCVTQHQKIINMLNVVNNCFSFCAVVQITTSTILVCLNGFQILLSYDNLHLLIRRILAIIVVLFQLFVWCWYGNKMSAAAESLTSNLWMCGWENEHKHGIRNIVSIPMILSLQSLELRAVGVVPLSLQTFVSALKTSYSVLVLLLTVAKDQ
ncbi:odorant receptor 13a [Microplitis demolitor]|uniref:odorant receptor 13a n=1 Tax=Microplitis demolitor TaxID=69319 RepID=UPI0004CD1F8F|nr:odorant receptor 13a [Microplitis demolitor]XP_053595334.1 odorant receptor 13a [Microplitis demolitor]XP_053595335.1 odorant receptor 13a [Microplitis demolitor]XP_053595336.1 odorant receptor 13a [Microplitis demolitor]